MRAYKLGYTLILSEYLTILKCSLFSYLQMSAIEKKTKHQVDELREGVKNMSVDMRMFSLTMRSLYAEKAVGTDEEVAKQFRKLRDDTRNDAMVYIEGILPLTTEFVTSISTYFEYYDALTFDEWCENISMIRKEVAEYKKLCHTMLKMHEEILVPLKKRRDQAGILLTKMKLLVAEFEKKKEALVKKGGTECVWATALGFIPVIGMVASPILSACGVIWQKPSLLESKPRSKKQPPWQ